MKLITISIIFFHVSCGENPEVAKQKKLDEAVKDIINNTEPEIRKIVGAIDNIIEYSEKLKAPEVKEYRRAVEEYSQDYYDDFLKFLPKNLQYIKPKKTKQFARFQNVLASVKREYKDIQGIYEEVIKSKNYLKFDDCVKEELSIVDQVLEVFNHDFEWFYEHTESSIEGLGELRQIAKALKFKVLIEVHRGDFEKAKYYISKSNKFAQKYNLSEGPLIVKLVGIAISGLDHSIIFELIDQNLLSYEQLKDLQKLYNSFEKRQTIIFEKSLSSELHRDVLWCAALKIEQVDYLLLELYAMTLFDENPQETLDWIKRELKKESNFNPEKYLKENILFYQALINDFQSKTARSKLSSQKYLDKIISQPKSIYTELSRLMLKPYPGIVYKSNSAYTKAEIIELLLSIKIYESEKGKLPESMTVLLDHGLSKVPTDYNAGLPVKYYKEERVIKIKGAGDYETSINF